MALINRAGTFRGNIVDRGMGASKNGFPQFVVQLHANEIYDDETGEWVDWSGYDESDITAFLVLFDAKNNQTLNCKQVEKVFGWNKESFEELNEIPFEELIIQFRVVESTFDNKTNFQVEWIDEFDAVPGRIIQKLNPDELKKMQAQYAKLLKKPEPAKAPSKTKPKAPQSKPKAPSAPKAPSVPEGKCTKEAAWAECVDFREDTVSDEVLSKTWVAKIEEIAGKKPDAEIAPEEWFKIKTAVLDEVGKKF